MKIGILTYHRAQNYGAFLQAVALHKFLTKKGYEVYFVDYNPAYISNRYRIINPDEFKGRNFISKAKYLVGSIISTLGRIQRRGNFNKFFIKYVSPNLLPYDADFEYDIVIYGSDQIWRKQISGTFDKVYFGVNSIKSKRKISYAASMGIVDLNYQDRIFLKKSLSDFKAVLVREDDLEYELKQSDITNARTVIDPTLLLNESDWEKLIGLDRIVHKKYLLYYKLGDCVLMDKDIEDLASKLDLKVITLYGGFTIKNNNKYSKLGPDGFLSLIKFSNFVVTSSYHGMLFSLNFKKQFYASFNKNSGRAKSILKSLGLEERLILSSSQLPLTDRYLDYEVVTPKLDKLRINSAKLLEDAIS